MSHTNKYSGGPYRSMPLRRSPAAKRAARQRRVTRLVLGRLRLWMAGSAFVVLLALSTAFVVGLSASPADKEIARHRRNAQESEDAVRLYQGLLRSSHASFRGIREILERCQERERTRAVEPTGLYWRAPDGRAYRVQP